MPQEILIDIDANGDVQVEGKNIVGPECTQLTAGIEEALGERTRVEKKPEFHRTKTHGITQTA